MPRPTEEAKIATRNTFITDLIVQPIQKVLKENQNLDLRIRYKLRGGIYDSFNRSTWQTAWQRHDIMLRLISKIQIYKKKFLLPVSITGELKFIKKGKLYWTRNPDLTDNITNRIWAFVVDEDSRPRFFDVEDKVKEALFDFDRVITIEGSKFEKGETEIFAKAEVRWGRHIYIERGSISATSPPVVIRVD